MQCFKHLNNMHFLVLPVRIPGYLPHLLEASLPFGPSGANLLCGMKASPEDCGPPILGRHFWMCVSMATPPPTKKKEKRDKHVGGEGDLPRDFPFAIHLPRPLEGAEVFPISYHRHVARGGEVS